MNPNGTSQECSNCGHKVKKPLSQRTHDCPECKVSLCRDLNASINIKNRGAHDLKAQLMSYEGVTQKPTPAFVGGVGMSLSQPDWGRSF